MRVTEVLVPTPIPSPEPGPSWSRVAALFEQALDQPDGGRKAWLARAAAGDRRLEAEVEALLQAHLRQGLLDRPSPAEVFAAAQDGEAIGRELGAALAGRYQIERILGEGGMATVFLARESKHDRAVVLKVLKPDMAAWLGKDRFQAEIQIVARLSHPHIIALIDSGEAEGLLYYVMPFVGGETLRAGLAAGPLSVTASLTVLRDLADALAHAHRHGIVHRDLKPENVLTVGGHGFLMDFGVAKLRPEPGANARTAEGTAIGTPAYMSPEQAAGSRVDQRADIYAWGLIAREALLGTPSRQLDLRSRRGVMPPALARLIEACLAESPADRPSNGEELLDRIEDIEADLRTGRDAPHPIRRLWPIGAVAAVAAGAVLVLRDPPPPPLEAVPGPVVVAGLRNETGDSTLSVWGRLAADWITQGLQKSGLATVIPWSVSLDASARASPAASPVEVLRDGTGAGSVVTGSYYAVGEELSFQLELIDAESGALLGAVASVRVSRDSIQHGVQQLRDRLLGALAVRKDVRLATTPGMSERPPTYDAYLHFERGLGLYNQLDYRTATEALLASWRSDTTFLAPLVYAARAIMNTGDRARVDSLLRELRRRQTSLGTYNDLQVQYLESVLAGQGLRALQAIQEAARHAPKSRAAYNVALAALTVNQPAVAVTALRSLDPDRGSISGWAPYWFTLSHALHLLGRHDEELAAVRELRRRHPDSRAGWVHEARVLAAMGRVGPLDSLLALAAALPPDTYWSQGAAMVTAAEELDAHGYASVSAQYYRRAEIWLANQLARDPAHRAHRYWLGSAYYDQARWGDAAPYFESLVRDYPDDFAFRGMFALLAARAGDSATAYRRLGEPRRYDVGEHTAYRARIAAVSGNLNGAVDLWTEAIGQGVGGLVWLHAAARRDLAPLRDNPRFVRLGLLSPALPGQGTS